jgi:hypothetical protein
MNGVAVGVLTYLVIVASPIALLAALPVGRQFMRTRKQWTVILGCVWLAATQPLNFLFATGGLPRFGATLETRTFWLASLMMVPFGLAIGWCLWKLMEANRPPERHW